MVVQNNPTPWIGFALFTAALCGVLGLVFGLDPFGPGQQARIEMAGTQHALSMSMTEGAFGLSQTPQAVISQQTLQAAQLTAIPDQQIATQVVGQWVLEDAQRNATYTAIVDEILIGQAAAQATKTSMAESAYLNRMAGAATSTAIAQGQAREQATTITGLSVLLLATIVFAVWLVSRLVTPVITARAAEKEAQAQWLAEQRQLLSLRSSIRAQRDERDQRYPIPASLMKKPDDSKDLPRAE